jgi:predicted ester cyclase
MRSFVLGNTGCILIDFSAKFQPIQRCQSNLRFERDAHLFPQEGDMTSKLDVVKAWYKMSWTNPPASNIEAAEKYISDDFQSLDRNGNLVMDKKTFVGMAQLMYAAFKDFKGVYSDLQEEGDGVIMSFHFEGTQTGDFDLSAMGLGVIPASGKRIVWPEAKTKFKVEGDKIVGEQEITGGMEWFLAPLGVKLPSA